MYVCPLLELGKSRDPLGIYTNPYVKSEYWTVQLLDDGQMS